MNTKYSPGVLLPKTSIRPLYKGQAFSRSTEPGWLNLILDEGLVHFEKPRQVATLVCRNFVIRDVWLKRTKKCKSK